MSGHSLLQLNTQLTAENARRDEAKKKVSEALRRVDQLIRKGDLALAQSEISKAKEIDPRNAYTLALEERLSNLKVEFERIEKTLQNRESTKTNDVSKTSEPVKETAQISAAAKPSASFANPATVSKTAIHPTLPNSTFVSSSVKIEEKHSDPIRNRNIELDTYRKTLMEAWYDGALTESEIRQLNELRTLLEITESEYHHIENNVRLECYRNAVAQHLSDNPKMVLNAKSFAELRRMFRISEEEHQQIQTQLLSTIQPQQQDRILVIDDDARLLELLQTSLEDNGFEVIALSTSDEAFALLRKFTPDLILCDINLETSTMGGFTFYEKIQELKNIQSVPFVFLTGLSDEALVRTGKELGVDDFLMKPISERMLVSALRGKLKRFKQINKCSQALKAS